MGVGAVAAGAVAVAAGAAAAATASLTRPPSSPLTCSSDTSGSAC